MPHDLFATLDGETKPETIERLFVGLRLPEGPARAATEILAQARAEGLRGPEIRQDRLHVTLIHVGDYANALRPSIVEAVLKACESLSSPAFEVTFDRVSSFAGSPGRYPLVLLGDTGVEALKAFRAELLKAVIRHGVKPLSRQDFNPHVTLSYADRRLPERPIGPVAWRPDEFVLIHSEVGRSIYHTLGRWPLR